MQNEPATTAFWQKYFPPNGWNCRCTTLEIWRDDPEAVVHFGITGRDPRKRTADDMNVPKEFRGNVGVFAAEPSKKEEPAPAPEPFPSTVRPVTQRDCINALLALQQFYGSEAAQEVKVVPTPAGCDVFLRGKFLTSIQAETNNDVHYSREPSRTFRTQIGGVRNVFRNLTDALISVLKGKVGGGKKKTKKNTLKNIKNIPENLVISSSIRYEFDENDDIIISVSKDQIESERKSLVLRTSVPMDSSVPSRFSEWKQEVANTLTHSEDFLRSELMGNGISGEGRNLERGVCIGTDGKIIGYHIGEDNKVSIEVDSGETLKGGFVSHSHPNFSPPSVTDIIVFFQYDLQELTVVTRCGRYRIIRDSQTVSKEEGIELAKRFKLFLGKNLENVKKCFGRLSLDEKHKYYTRSIRKNNTKSMIEDLAKFEFIYEKMLVHFADKLDIRYEDNDGQNRLG